MRRARPMGRCVVLAAGGTGGHMFPAEALARTVLGRGHGVALITDRRGAAFGGNLPEVAVERIAAPRMAAGLVGRVRTGLALLTAYAGARRRLRALKPAVVVGFGGYASAPTLLAAYRAGVPTVLHEQNALVGRTNRWLAGRATAIATAFADVRGLSPQQQDKVRLCGNPVRPAVLAVRDRPYRPPAAEAGESQPIHLLVLGGSQGARVFGEVVPDALMRLPETLRRRLIVTLQCRAEDLSATREAFSRLGLRGEVDDFFQDVPERLAEAQLAICRAGASTVAELAAVGRPAILVPYPFAMDDHQSANARALAVAGGAETVVQDAFTPDWLAARLVALLGAPARLSAMADAARACARVDAAARLADLALTLGGLVDGTAPDRAGHRREAAA